MKGNVLRVWIVRADTKEKVWKEETGFRKGGKHNIVVRECYGVKDDVVSDQDRKGNVENMNVSKWVTNMYRTNVNGNTRRDIEPTCLKPIRYVIKITMLKYQKYTDMYEETGAVGGGERGLSKAWQSGDKRDII